MYYYIAQLNDFMDSAPKFIRAYREKGNMKTVQFFKEYGFIRLGISQEEFEQLTGGELPV